MASAAAHDRGADGKMARGAFMGKVQGRGGSQGIKITDLPLPRFDRDREEKGPGTRGQGPGVRALAGHEPVASATGLEGTCKNYKDFCAGGYLTEGAFLLDL